MSIAVADVDSRASLAAGLLHRSGGPRLLSSQPHPDFKRCELIVEDCQPLSSPCADAWMRTSFGAAAQQEGQQDGEGGRPAAIAAAAAAGSAAGSELGCDAGEPPTSTLYESTVLLVTGRTHQVWAAEY